MFRRDVLKGLALLPIMSTLSFAKSESKHEYSKEELSLLVASAIHRNILVYDADADVGKMTERLISLSRTIFVRNSNYSQKNTEPERVFSPMCKKWFTTKPVKRKITDILCETNPPEDVIAHCNKYCNHKIKIHIVPELKELFKRFDGNHAFNDKYVALAVDMRNIQLPYLVECDEVMLMSY